MRDRTIFDRDTIEIVTKTKNDGFGRPRLSSASYVIFFFRPPKYIGLGDAIEFLALTHNNSFFFLFFLFFLYIYFYDSVSPERSGWAVQKFRWLLPVHTIELTKLNLIARRIQQPGNNCRSDVSKSLYTTASYYT